MKPKTYLDKFERKNDKYYFISYSHKDKDIVYSILNELYQNGVNYWYDVELDPGDKWNDKVESILTNKNCLGAVFFLSEHTAVSDAVRQEIKIMLNNRANRMFSIIPVIIGFDDPDDIFQKIISNDKKYVRSENLNLLNKVSYEDIIRISEDSAVQEITNLANKNGVCTSGDINIEKRVFNLDYHNINKEKIYLCGRYFYNELGEEKPIEWKLISESGNILYFVSRYGIDFVDIENIDQTIENIKKTIESDINVVSLSLIDDDFLNTNIRAISNVIPTNYADRNRQQLLRLFWVTKKETNELILYNSQNVEIKTSIEKENINAGIRLVLAIKED